jgi:nitrogen fixation NifU-like protein
MMEPEIFSEIILDLYKNPVNFGHLKEFDLKATGGNPFCGDEVSFELKIDNGKVSDIRFSGKGCAISRASESLLTEMVKGKTLFEIKEISSERVFEELGGVIQTRAKCALLGLGVLKRGVEEFEKNGSKKTVALNLDLKE